METAGAGVAAGVGAPRTGAAVAPRGVPQRAQNLNVAALRVMQFGHCFGGVAEVESRGAGGLAGIDTDFCIRVGISSASEAPHERQEPTSVSFCAPQRGQSMRRFYSHPLSRVKEKPRRAAKEKEGRGGSRPRFHAAFPHW